MGGKVKIFVGAVVLLVGMMTMMTMAQQDDIDAQNAVKKRSQERLAEIERLGKALSGRVISSERELRVARSTIQAKRRVAADLEKEIRRVTGQMTADTRRKGEMEDSLVRLRNDYGRMVYAAWKSRKTSDATLFLLSSRDFNDASKRINFLRRYNHARQRHGYRIDSMARSLEANVKRLGIKKRETEELKSTSDKLLKELAAEEKSYEQALKRLAADQDILKQEARREREKINAAQREITRILARQAAAARSSSMNEADIRLTGQFGDNKGRLPWPVGPSDGGGIILRHFGKERSADGIESDFKGLIVGAEAGSEVRAVFEGEVTWISALGQYDKCVMVRSGEYVVSYGNIAAPAVAGGDRVETGQVLGRLGTSNNPDRNLVMLWMQIGNRVLNPEEWLRSN
jgi:septal ring factor EnvC (AmiA/AmiB activator)